VRKAGPAGLSGFAMLPVFYVYEHWRPDTGTVFYVGKGKERRAWDSLQGRNRWHKAIQKHLVSLGLEFEVRIVVDGLTEREAFAEEIRRIAEHRLAGAKLCNLSDGGEGPSGRKHTEEWKAENSRRMKGRKVSEETKKKISDAHKGKQWALGYKKTPEQIEKTRIAQLGRKKSQSEIENMSAAQKRRLSDPAAREVLSVRAQERFSDPGEREKTSRTTREACAKPEVRAVFSENARRRWGLIPGVPEHPEAAAQRKKFAEKYGKKVVCHQNGMVFTSIKEAANHIGASESGVALVVKKKRNSVFGYTFSFVEEAA